MEVGKKKPNNNRTFMFSRSILKCRSWFTAPLKNLQWGRPNGIAMEYCFSIVQVSDVACSWVRGAPTAWGGKATHFSTTLGILLPSSTNFDPEIMEICFIAVQNVICRAIYNSQKNSVVTSSCSHKTVFPSASGDESAVVITRVRERLEKMSVPSTLAVKNSASKWFLHGTFIFFFYPGHQTDY